jgi:DNA repair exonuclease SbcCD ATPase subunit
LNFNGLKRKIEFERTAMKRAVYNVVILTADVVIMLIGGCGGEDTSKSEIKRDRLIAAENRQLKKQLEQFGGELEKQKKLLAKSVEEKKTSEERLRKDHERKLKTAAIEHKILHQTIERLEAQVKQLEERIAELQDSTGLKKREEERQKEINDLIESSFRDFEEIVKLSEENEKLQAEIAGLKKGLETHKGPTPLQQME